MDVILHDATYLPGVVWLIALVNEEAMGRGGLWAVLLGAGLLAGVMLTILLLISRSVSKLRRGAARFASGDLSQPVDVAGPLQLSALAESLNQMAEQLGSRLDAVVQQRNEMAAVLWSMNEGVLAIDLDQRVLSLNRAAAELLRLDAQKTIGRPVPEVIRNAALLDLVQRTLEENAPVQDEVSLRLEEQPGADVRQFQTQSAILHDAAGRRTGALLVLHDVTPLRKLEGVRREFVANVSHELKTPVSAVKAAVETLRDHRNDPEAAERFLQIIARQADRLAAIIEDLLSLARLEQQQGRIGAELALEPVRPVMEAARETCQAEADAKGVRINVEGDSAVRAPINPALLEQALVNLVTNAIKYSPPDTQVRVELREQAEGAVVAVIDEGRGIEPEHLPRIFERFYRTDKARSRALGGTGLGLSIVKHVAEAHGGRVSVDSRVGVGSTFRIHLRPGV